jgi:hypothetical protein
MLDFAEHLIKLVLHGASTLDLLDFYFKLLRVQVLLDFAKFKLNW